MKSAIAIRHVQFEDLGTLGPLLESAGYRIRYADVCIDDVASIDAIVPDLIVVLGGPIGTYEDDGYPTLRDELRLLETRLAASAPRWESAWARSSWHERWEHACIQPAAKKSDGRQSR